MPKADTFGAEDGSTRSSSDAEDNEFEADSTRKTSQICAGVLHPGGPPSNIHMENNSDVQIGSRLHYNAPVTINQYVSVLGNSDVTQNSFLHEAVKVPIPGVAISENISQGKLTKAAVVPHGVSRWKTKWKQQKCLEYNWVPIMASLSTIFIHKFQEHAPPPFF
jgi:hypothetical protein